MLDQIARHGMMDLSITAKGDLHIDAHHTVEDIGITLGQAFRPPPLATRKASSATDTPTCPWTRRCRAW
jgi:imidazoleglycerol phosphate dehydratase HisB